ncbi:autotransporter assembly complex family protein [Sphingomonas hankookensis]|uniref:autotransporter assembly complex protein TamA n=1 Tax=Sphingomonas hankookensis TaxID=563996 RepID=UPI001F55C73C|nr:BamA/TamA family outer membrane protein [Sphingomonas hankookensis]
MTVVLLAGTMLAPTAFAQDNAARRDPPAAPTVTTTAQPSTEAIVPDPEFNAALPSLSGDINAPLEPMSAFDTSKAATQQPAPLPAPAPQPTVPVNEAQQPAETLPEAPELAQPLTPLSSFDVTPVEVAGVDDKRAVEIRYETVVKGLEKIDDTGQFKALSALQEGDGKAANAAMVQARAKEDEQLAVRIMRAKGYYDGTATSAIEQPPGQRLRAVVTAVPGRQFTLGSIRIDTQPTVPQGLVDKELPLKVGDAIDAERIQAAEANVSLKLPQQGYPFVEVGQRDILLDDTTVTGAYTLPVTTGPRSSFGTYSTTGKLAFDAEHVGVLARFKQGELYDNRKVDDLRAALVATGLFSGVSVEPQRTGQIAADGTEAVNLLVKQDAGPARTLAGEAGYGTGQGIRLEGSWTHRNLFPAEGALIVRGVAGTQEQGAGVTFRRSNAGQRDRTFQILANASRTNYDAFEAFTGTLGIRWSYDSTPIWQKRFTYAYGAELIGTNEDTYDFDVAARRRKTYGIAALPLFAGFDTSDNLLNPTKGFRVKLNVSPEAAVQGAVRPYGRFMLEGTAYYPFGESIVIAGRARAGSIQGIARDDLAPSRRYYAGGGGSVRGFGFQELGPRTPEVDEDGNNLNRPIGGRSLNEFALEARYRFGNFGIVPFIDAGQVYESSLPKGSDLRFGAGIGGRFYTNFGPMRVDVATPIARRPGESKIALYISIGQAF